MVAKCRPPGGHRLRNGLGRTQEIDGEESTGQILKLRQWGCRVVSAASPDAILAGMTDQERPDLIICDYRLADGHSGIQAIEELRMSFQATIPAFLISGDTAPERLREAQESGHHLLHKPVRPMKLRILLSHLLKSHAESAPPNDSAGFADGLLHAVPGRSHSPSSLGELDR